jgi:hypothetical protein
MVNIEESVNTLKFAQRIKRVVTRATTNEMLDDEKALLQRYRVEIDGLKSKLNALTHKEVESSQLAAEKMRLEEELLQQQLVRTALKERIDHLTKLILTSSSFNTQAILNTWQPGPSGAGADTALANASGGIGGANLRPRGDRMGLSVSNMDVSLLRDSVQPCIIFAHVFLAFYASKCQRK